MKRTVWPFGRTVWLVIRKDLTIELRTRTLLLSMLLLVALLAVVLGIAFAHLAPSGRVISGVLWVLVLFATMHGLHRSFDTEFQDDALQGLVLTGADPAALYIGKILGTTLVLILVSLGGIALLSLFLGFGALLPVLPLLMLLIALVTLGLATVGGILTVMSRQGRLGETLLPILFLPLVIPLLLAGIEGMAAVLETGLLPQAWLRLVIGYDLGMLVATAVFFEYVLEG